MEYVHSEFLTPAMKALAAGKSGMPEHLDAAGVKASGQILFGANLVAADTVTIGGVVFTAKTTVGPAVGKIVFTGNILAADVVVINGVTFTAKAEAAPAVGKVVFTGNILAADTVTVNTVVFTAKAPAAPAVGKVVFTGNILADDVVVINGVTFTAMAAGAAGELQFDVGANLSNSLDALITKLNGCTDVLVSYATYSKTDTNTAVTSTSDTNNEAQNDLVLSSTHDSVVVTAPTGAVNAATGAQFDVGANLSDSLDALITLLNASVNVLVSYATYSKTDTNTAVTSTSDTNNSAHNDIVLASTHDSVVVTAPVGGSSAASAVQFDVKGTLSLSLDQLVTALNASVNVLVSYATYSKTDTNTALTSTSDTNDAAHNDLVLSSTHDSVVVTAPVGGAPAASVVQFDVKSTLSLTLDQLVTKLNASANAAVSVATYSKVETDKLKVLRDTYGISTSPSLAYSGAGETVTAVSAGQAVQVISLNSENTSIDIDASLDVDQNFTLADGDEFQRKTILLYGAAGDGNAVITPANLTGGTTITLDTDGDWIKLEFLNGAWAKIAGVGDTIA